VFCLQFRSNHFQRLEKIVQDGRKFSQGSTVLLVLENHLWQCHFVHFTQEALWPRELEGHSYQLVKNLYQLVFYERHFIFVKDLAISFVHFHNQECVFKLVVNGIFSFFNNDFLELADGFFAERFQELFVLLDRVVNQLPNNVVEESSVGLAEFFDVEFVA
jgi:hypothetical protein